MIEQNAKLIEIAEKGTTINNTNNNRFNLNFFLNEQCKDAMNTNDFINSDVTGEMGTGFFNVYRQPYTKYVEIITCLNNKQTKIIATPIILKDRVTDIQYSIQITN